MSQTPSDKIYKFTAGATFSLSGFVKTGLTGTLSGYAQIFNGATKVADLVVDVQPVLAPPAAPYADFTHTVLITYPDSTSAWPVGELKTNVLIVDGAGHKVPTFAYVVHVSSELSEVL